MPEDPEPAALLVPGCAFILISGVFGAIAGAAIFGGTFIGIVKLIVRVSGKPDYMNLMWLTIPVGVLGAFIFPMAIWLSTAIGIAPKTRRHQHDKPPGNLN